MVYLGAAPMTGCDEVPGGGLEPPGALSPPTWEGRCISLFANPASAIIPSSYQRDMNLYYATR